MGRDQLRWLSQVVAVGVALLVIAGCAPTGQATRGDAPTQPSAAAATEPAEPRPASPAPTASAGGAAWEQTVAAAREEGKLVILGAPGTDMADALSLGFRQAYPGIELTLQAGMGVQLTPKLLNERAAGQYLADLYIGGAPTSISALLPAGAVDPITPFLVGPEARNTAPWRDGRFEFSDNAGQNVLVFATTVNAPIGFNPSLVPTSAITSYRDLLQPQWKGKVVVRDSRTPGPGQAVALLFYVTPSLGKDFLEQLMASGVVVAEDDRQIADWVARGQYPVALGISDAVWTELINKGLPIDRLNPEQIVEGTHVTSGFGTASVINNAPHPNAVKVYLDWLVSREAQTAWSKAAGNASRRLDVPTDHLPGFAVPKPGVQYVKDYTEPNITVREELVAYLRSIMPR